MDESQTLKRAKSIRGPNPYNIFCAEFFKQGKNYCTNKTATNVLLQWGGGGGNVGITGGY